MASMADLEYWPNALRNAERDLDAVNTCTALNLAARRLKLPRPS
jgi:hypothetical protein